MYPSTPSEPLVPSDPSEPLVPFVPSVPGLTETIVIESNATSVVSPSATPHLIVYGVAAYAVGELNVAVSEFAAVPSVKLPSFVKASPVNLNHPFVKLVDVPVNTIVDGFGVVPSAA